MLEQWEISKIITVCNELTEHGNTSGSTGEHIAAAFVLNRVELLPTDYADMVHAWDRLGTDWQNIVRHIKASQMHRIQRPAPSGISAWPLVNRDA